MTGPVRIAVLGGSSAFFPAFALALAARSKELPELEIRLYGRDLERTGLVASACERLARQAQVAQRYRASGELAATLEGASIVINQVRIGGLQGRQGDEVFPLEYGLPGDETLGPGGLASALRGLPRVRALAQAVLEHAPEAWFVQMSNPMGILLAGLRDLTRLKTFGLCELPGETLRIALSWLAGSEPGVLGSGGVEWDYAGLNHQGWFYRLEQGGRDLLGPLLAALKRGPAPKFLRLAPGALERWQALPLPYLALLFDPSAVAREAQQAGSRRAAQLEALSAVLYARYRDPNATLPPAELSQRSTVWFELALVPALVGLLGGASGEVFVSEQNRGHLALLGPQAIVEKPAHITPAGPQARRLLQAPPEHLAAWIRRTSNYEELALRAALEPDSATVEAALQALPMDYAARHLEPLRGAVLAAGGVSR